MLRSPFPFGLIELGVEEGKQLALTVRYVFAKPVADTDERVKLGVFVLIVLLVIGIDDALQNCRGFGARTNLAVADVVPQKFNFLCWFKVTLFDRNAKVEVIEASEDFLDVVVELLR